MIKKNELRTVNSIAREGQMGYLRAPNLYIKVLIDEMEFFKLYLLKLKIKRAF